MGIERDGTLEEHYGISYDEEDLLLNTPVHLFDENGKRASREWFPLRSIYRSAVYSGQVCVQTGYYPGYSVVFADPEVELIKFKKLNGDQIVKKIESIRNHVGLVLRLDLIVLD